MLEFHILTLFPEMFTSFQQASICKRALDASLIDISLYNFREYSTDKHNRVDDAPFGGGAGMVIAPQSVFDCFADIEIAQLQKKRNQHLYVGFRGAINTPAGARTRAV